MKKGIFWCMDKNDVNLYTVSVACNSNGIETENVVYSSKSGTNFNHKTEWEKADKKITGTHPYNYYPRGRVEVKNGRAIIFLNPDINTKEILEEIYRVFELKEDELKNILIKSDGSHNYGYYMDDYLV